MKRPKIKLDYESETDKEEFCDDDSESRTLKEFAADLLLNASLIVVVLGVAVAGFMVGC